MKASIMRWLFPMTTSHKINRFLKSLAAPAKEVETFTRIYRDNLKEKKSAKAVETFTRIYQDNLKEKK